MKHTTKSFLRSIMLMMVVVIFIDWSSTSSQEYVPSGYIRSAKAGTDIENVPCGENTFVVLENASDEITTGTTAWANPAMTVPFPDGVVISQYGTTYGLSFAVVNGVIDAPASPSCP